MDGRSSLYLLFRYPLAFSLPIASPSSITPVPDYIKLFLCKLLCGFCLLSRPWLVSGVQQRASGRMYILGNCQQIKAHGAMRSLMEWTGGGGEKIDPNIKRSGRKRRICIHDREGATVRQEENQEIFLATKFKKCIREGVIHHVKVC